LWYRLRGRQLAGYKFRRQQTMGVYIVDLFVWNPGSLMNWMAVNMEHRLIMMPSDQVI
jgi:hypothetical protein